MAEYKLAASLKGHSDDVGITSLAPRNVHMLISLRCAL
jgi:hypothetical protein